MNKIDLIIENIEYAKLVTEQAHKDELLDEALAAARELKDNYMCLKKLEIALMILLLISLVR